MTEKTLTDWDEDVVLSEEEEYDALVRAISWAKGFGLLFVQCSPSEGEQIIPRIREDVTDKTVEVLRLEAEIDDLHAMIASQPHIETTDVLFITGLEKSLVDYIQAGYGSEGDYYAKDSIPKLLGKLNLQREVFKQDFKVCFVFLVPRYAMKYLIRRAADFFDWRSGVWEFVPSEQILTQEKQRVLESADYQQYVEWTAQQRQERCLEIDDLLDHDQISDDEQWQLLVEQGNIFVAGQNYEDAIASYDKALQIKPNDDSAWVYRGIALDQLGRFEDAIASYDKALQIKPNNDEAWYIRGIALRQLGRFEDAIDSFDKALEIKPNKDEAWYNRGIALGQLGRFEDAIDSFDKALEIKPNKDEAIYNKACCYALWNKPESTLKHLQQAIALNSEYQEMARHDSDFASIKNDPHFQALLAQETQS